ncbi:uncharacterized protein LOC141827230 [Curcuma longa]|uniref:uncharacterized protein LOC141827230 n=1 Tax=Curcuma longa TaxID=136217 RepID=UPI003D9E1265
MDIVGPLPVDPSQKKFLLAPVDYFSKWVEAKSLTQITEKSVLKFLWQNITKVVNRVLVQGLKTKLNHVEGSWVDELPDILWAYRTTPRDSIRMTSFHLIYRGEVVVPVEIDCESARVRAYAGAEDNAAQRSLELDLITEICDQANRWL